MAFNIKDEHVHEAVKRIASITGESQSRAVSVAVAQRLAQLERDDLSARLLRIGAEATALMGSEFRKLDYDEELYDKDGLPR